MDAISDASIGPRMPTMRTKHRSSAKSQSDEPLGSIPDQIRLKKGSEKSYGVLGGTIAMRPSNRIEMRKAPEIQLRNQIRLVASKGKPRANARSSWIFAVSTFTRTRGNTSYVTPQAGGQSYRTGISE